MASVPTSSSSTERPPPSSDEELLRELGYEQELHRGMSGFSSFAVSFSIISVLAGCITTYYLAMDARGSDRHHRRLAGRGALRAVCGACHGGDLLALPDRRRALLVGQQAGYQEQPPMGLVHRLVQLLG